MSESKNGQKQQPADIRKWIKHDLEAAISLLSILRDHPEMLEGIAVALEDLQSRMEKAEAQRRKKAEEAVSSLNNGK